LYFKTFLTCNAHVIQLSVENTGYAKERVALVIWTQGLDTKDAEYSELLKGLELGRQVDKSRMHDIHYCRSNLVSI